MAVKKNDQWFKSYGHFTEGLDLADWWSLGGGGPAPAACTAGLFILNSLKYIVTIKGINYFKDDIFNSCLSESQKESKKYCQFKA